MITALVLEHLWQKERPERLELPWRGSTVGAVLQEVRERCPRLKGQKVAATIGGKRVREDELPYILADDVQLVVAPDPEGFFEVVAIVSLVLTVLSVAYQLLVGKPKPLNQPAERGDEQSPTYAWNQIATEYRQGFPIPLILGRHDVGGQVIYTDVFASAGGINIGAAEFLRVIIAFGVGRIHKIGGITGGDLGEENGLFASGLGGFQGQTTPSGGTIPADFRINGNRFDDTVGLPGVRCWLRMGEEAQSPLPSNPFRGVTTTLIVNQDLDEMNSTAVQEIAAADLITTIAGVIAFPGGLYAQDNSGNLSPVSMRFDVDWRPVGEIPWRPGTIVNILPTSPYLNPVSMSWGFDPNRGGTITGPIQVRMTRKTPSGSALQQVSRSTWRQLIYNLNLIFSYPGIALMGFEAMATEKVTGARSNFVNRIDGLKVRVWDSSIGGGNPSTARYWDVPTGSYAGIWSYPVGQNPAWLLAEFLTNVEGLGRHLSDAQIDWPAFRDWADFCDGDVDYGPGQEARFTCNLVLDAPASAWEVVLRICATGRAMPVIKNGKISVKYEFAASHGRGSNTVAAKERTQLFTSGNVEELVVSYFDPKQRPGVIDFQILDEEEDYQQKIEPVLDPDGGFDDPRESAPIAYTRQPYEAFGITRKSQVHREGLFIHRVNKNIKSEINFKVGPEAVACELGDVIGMQHDILRPYDTESFGYRLSAASAASTTIRLDHAVTLAALTTYEVVIREDDGTVTTATVTSVAGAYAAGAAITISGAVTAQKGAPLAFGRQNKVVKDYLLINLTLEQDMRRALRALEWHPSIYTDDDVYDDIADESNPLARGQSDTFSEAAGTAPALEATDVRIQPTQLPGRQQIGWTLPVGYESSSVKVFARIAESESSWWLLAEVKGNTLEWTFAVGETYEIAVVVTDKLGTFQLPDDTNTHTFTADEFPPARVPNIVHGTITPTREGKFLKWSAIDTPFLDYYEVRGGAYWAGAQVLARVRANEVELLGSGVTGTFQVKARFRNGLYSEEALLLEGGDGAPAALTDEFADAFNPVDFTGYTIPDGLTDGVGSLALENGCGFLLQTFTTPTNEFDLTTLAERFLVITFETRQHDLLTVDDADFGVDSGEAHWRTADARDASIGNPGYQITETVDDFAIAIDDVVPERLTATYAGQPGFKSAVVVEVRFSDDGSSFGDWEPYRPGWRTFREFEVRFTLLRFDDDTEVFVENVSIQAFS